MPSSVREIDDRDLLHGFFLSRGHDPYAIANLDGHFWPRTRWWGSQVGGRLEAAVGTIEGVLSIPILYAVAPEHDSATKHLLETIAEDLPDRMLALLPDGEAPNGFSVEDYGEQRQMVLTAAPVPDPGVVDVGPADQPRILEFLATAYREDEQDLRVFELYMIERWPHVALIVEGAMVALAGTHVLTERFSAAGLGNIVTRPANRGRGLAGRLVSSLCHRLKEQGLERIGLNVAERNLPARRCYERIGFTYSNRFRECLLSRQADKRELGPQA